MHVRHVNCQERAKNRGSAEKSGQAETKTFLSGVMILTLSTMLVKVVGLFYKIPMLRYLGSVGMGYFNAAYECYATCCVFATAGLPIAVSMGIARVLSGDRDEFAKKQAVARIERLSMRIFVSLGLLGTLLLYGGATAMAHWMDSPKTAAALRAVAPTVLFSCMSSAYRGYFQGCQNMLPTALSQMIEALGKLVFGLLFARFAVARGMDVPTVAAYAMLGLSLGVAISSLYLAVARWCYRLPVTRSETPCSVDAARDGTESSGSVFRRLMSVAVPVTLSSAVLSLAKMIDLALILRRLQQIGYTTEQANGLYGIYTTMAVPIFNLIPSLLTSVSLALIPALSAQIAKKDLAAQRETLSSALRLTILPGVAASFALSLYSRPILMLLFHPTESDLQYAVPMLTLLGASVVFSGLMTTTNAMLQAYGHPRAPIYSMLIGSAVKLISAYFLLSLPSLHILGAPISTLLCNVTVVGINLTRLAKRTDALVGLRRTLWQPLCFALPAVGLPALGVYGLAARGWDIRWLFLAAVPATLLLLLPGAVDLGIMDKKKLLSFPVAARLTRRRNALTLCHTKERNPRNNQATK